MKKETNAISQILLNGLKGVLSLLVHILKLVYLIIQWFNNLMAKMFLKLPRLLRVIIIYSLIALSIFAILVLTKNIKVSFM